ncbi:SLAM family [Pimephales promelas]|nr:SLAM family [Pimephales promelas]
MDSQTGSLTIRNIRSDLTGLYKLQILSNSGTSYKRFNVTVYARLPTPAITRHFSSVQNPSSSSSRSSESRCSLVCSAVNVSHVTLSWYKGMSVLSGISASNISISLSLPLEIQCLDDSYRCVVSYSFTNRTTHLNTDLCHTCSDVIQPSLLIPLTSVGLLMVYAAVVLVKYCKEASQQDLTTTESEYTQIYYLQTGDLPQYGWVRYGSLLVLFHCIVRYGSVRYGSLVVLFHCMVRYRATYTPKALFRAQAHFAQRLCLCTCTCRVSTHDGWNYRSSHIDTHTIATWITITTTIPCIRHPKSCPSSDTLHLFQGSFRGLTMVLC